MAIIKGNTLCIQKYSYTTNRTPRKHLWIPILDRQPTVTETLFFIYTSIDYLDVKWLFEKYSTYRYDLATTPTFNTIIISQFLPICVLPCQGADLLQTKVDQLIFAIDVFVWSSSAKIYEDKTILCLKVTMWLYCTSYRPYPC